MTEYTLVTGGGLKITAPKGDALQTNTKNSFTLIKSKTKKYGKRIKRINEVTHHPSGWRFCGGCKKIKEEQKYGE